MKVRMIGIGILVCIVVVGSGSAWAGQRVTAAIMVSAGSDTLPGENGSDAFIVEVSTKTSRRFITSSQLPAAGCAVLPLTVPVGTVIEITGVLQGTYAIPGRVQAFRGPIVVDNGFDVEAYSSGLSMLKGEFDPNSPANMIASDPSFGFAWYDSSQDGKPGPYSYTVKGCGAKSCATKVNYFNQINPSGAPLACSVLMPMS